MGRLPDECPEEEKIKGKVEQIFQVGSLPPPLKLKIFEFQIHGRFAAIIYANYARTI